MKLSFRFKHGSSTPFGTIKPGTAELGSARLLSTASLAVPHGSSTTCFQTACYRHAELNSFNQLNLFCIISIYYALFAYITYGATVLGSTFETAAVLSSCHFRAKFIRVRHGSSTTFGTGLTFFPDAILKPFQSVVPSPSVSRLALQPR